MSCTGWRPERQPSEVTSVVLDNGQTSPLRGLRLLDGERIEDRFVPDTGSVPETPEEGPLLVLTSHRIISFSEDNGDKRVSAAAVVELEGVSIAANTGGFRDLFQGLFLLVVGILTYIVLGYILNGITIALALGSAIALIGVLFIGKHLFWEEDGSVTFLAGAWQASLTYRNGQANSDLYRLIDRCFQLKLDTGAPTVHRNAEEPPANAPLGVVDDQPQGFSSEPAGRSEPGREADQRTYRPWWARTGPGSNDPWTPPPSGAA